MQAELDIQGYLVIQGYIDAKDDRGRTMCGTFLSVVSRRDMQYLSVMFTREEIGQSIEWTDLLLLHEGKDKNTDRDPLIIGNEEDLYKYLHDTNTLNAIAKNRNAKPAEQAISRYCLDQLSLKAVCFIEFFDARDRDLETFADSENYLKKMQAEKENGGQVAIDDVAKGGGSGDDSAKEIFIRCDPILDPVNGIALADLSVGDTVYGKLQSDSVFYRLLSKNIPGFDGVITAQISGILINELGTATVSLDLSDGVSGVMKLSATVRIKSYRGSEKDGGKEKKTRANLPPEVVFAAAGLVLVASALYLVFYILM